MQLDGVAVDGGIYITVLHQKQWRPTDNEVSYLNAENKQKMCCQSSDITTEKNFFLKNEDKIKKFSVLK